MAGSSIAAPSAMAWVTDFCNAAYYARDPGERDVDDLRLALVRPRHAVGVAQRPAPRCPGPARLRQRVRRRPRRAGGRLDRQALLDGAARLLGDWFGDAYHDDQRRAHGVAFETVGAREAFEPSRYLRRGALKDLTPPKRPAEERLWATYDPVVLPDPDAALRLLLDPARWPDMASAAGRFTAVAGTELPGATFEISVIAAPAERAPIFTRAYVTCTGVHRDAPDLDAEVRGLAAAVPRCVSDRRGRRRARRAHHAPRALPRPRDQPSADLRARRRHVHPRHRMLGSAAARTSRSSTRRSARTRRSPSGGRSPPRRACSRNWRGSRQPR